MRIFNNEEILNLEKYFRINLINTSSGIKSANLIGTVNSENQSNLAIFNSVVHLGANPPCLGFIMRPISVRRHTYENIKQLKYYTINQVNSNIIQQAHQTSAKYAAGDSEFEKCNLTEEYLDDFPVPFVKESKIKIGLSYIEENVINFNKTILIVGRIEKLIVPDKAIQEDGCINHEQLETTSVSGLNSYYKSSLASKLKFARP